MSIIILQAIALRAFSARFEMFDPLPPFPPTPKLCFPDRIYVNVNIFYMLHIFPNFQVIRAVWILVSCSIVYLRSHRTLT